MGTIPQGKRPSNDVTISRGTTTRRANPETGKAGLSGNPAPEPEAQKMPERSFAQPSPVAPQKEVTPKTHASKKDEKEAIKNNSTLRNVDDQDPEKQPEVE